MENKLSLEEQIAALQAQIDLIKNGGAGKSLSKQLQQVRLECREKYFGSWDEMREGQVQYGPAGKMYSDYSAIMEIVNKATGLLFKYSRGKSSGRAIISGLIETKEDLEEYREICEKVCEELRNGVDKYTKLAS